MRKKIVVKTKTSKNFVTLGTKVFSENFKATFTTEKSRASFFKLFTDFIEALGNNSWGEEEAKSWEEWGIYLPHKVDKRKFNGGNSTAKK